MIKVAAYCRVSTDSTDQSNSFDAQQRYFRNYIEANKDWELYEIYADEGITGTSTRKRTQFNQMIRDAYAGMFSLIVTKEVSRFSRNILDTISYTRELRSIGVGVYFATDRIHTMDPESEMLLSLLASMAQEESRKTSTRVTWGQTRQMERGVVFGPSLLGYWVNEGALTINRDEAWIVRLIFHKYAVEQTGITEIARYLTSKGCHTHTGSTRWQPGTVAKILKNEKYVGDLIQKKTYTPDYLTHEKRKNKGEVPTVEHSNHHEPIISREIWNLTQQRLAQNRKQKNADWGHSNRYVFSGKIRCGECGKVFVCRTKYLNDGKKVRRWSCRGAVCGGTDVCSIGKLIRDDDAMHMVKTAIESLQLDIDALAHSIYYLTKTSNTPEHRQVEQNIARMMKKKKRMLDSYFSGNISMDDMILLKGQYEAQITSLQQLMLPKDDANIINSSSAESVIKRILMGEETSEVFYKTLLDSLTVFKDGRLELRLNGLTNIFVFSYR